MCASHIPHIIPSILIVIFFIFSTKTVAADIHFARSERKSERELYSYERLTVSAAALFSLIVAICAVRAVGALAAASANA